MKNISRVATTSTMAVAAVAIAAGTATAAPALQPVAVPTQVSVDVLPGVHYTGDTADGSVVLSTPFGSLTTVSGQFQLLDVSNKLIAGAPLPDAKAATPVAAPAPAPSAAATPVSAAAGAAAVPNLPLHNVDAQADFNSALAVAATQFGLGVTAGTVAGGALGVIVGCPVGAITGGTLATPVTAGTLTLPGAIAGCLIGAGTVGTVGGILGGAIVGIPVGIASAVQMAATLSAPPAPEA